MSLTRVRGAMLVVALLQGAALYGLHRALDARVWPANDPRWLFPLYAVATLVPLVLHLDLAHLRDPLFVRGTAAFAALLMVLGACAGATVVPSLSRDDFPVTLAFGLSMVALWWVVTPFLQASVRSGRVRLAPPYAELFEAGWQNTLVVVQAALFTLLFWALLFLWAELFDVVGVGVFESLFQEPAFAYPVTSVTFGYAVALAQSREQFVLLLRRHLFGVLLWLLPLVAFIASAFLVTLPATGLAPLWKTGHATFLMLWLQVFLLFFFNAAYQDGVNPPPYPAWLRVALRVACVAVPVYASLCVYSLSLRIAQHGLSVDRVWALLFTAVIGLYGAGYAFAALRDGPWMARLGSVNTAMAGVLAVLIVAVVTPLLEPKRLAAADQVSRLLAGKVPAAKFDYDYLRFNLGVFGDRALRRLAAGPGGHAESAEIARRASATLAKSSRWEDPGPPPDLAAAIEVLPRGAALDPELLAFFRRQADSSAGAGLICLRVSGLACVVLIVDLDGDGVEEVASVNGFPMNVYQRSAGGWRRVGELREEMGQVYGSPLWLDSIRSMPARATPSRWHVLEAGGRRLYLAESGPR
jgi:hypothetical protein